MSTSLQAVSPENCHPERSESSAPRAIRAAEGPLPTSCNVWGKANRVRCLALAILREIFDESAYARFLRRHQLAASRESYAAFRSEHEHNKAIRPRCC